MFAELILGGLLIFVFAWFVFKRPDGLPPGEWGLPLFGYIPLNGKYINFQLKDLQAKYGDIYIWRFGSQLQLFVHDYSISKQMFGSSDFSDRPVVETLKPDDGDPLGIFGSSGAIWQTNRRFSLRQLRDLGMGKSHMVMAIQEEALKLVDDMKKDSGKEGPITMSLNSAVVNIIWSMVAGKTFDSDAQIHKDLQHILVLIGEAFGKASMVSMFWWVKYVLPRTVFRKMFKLDIEKEAEDKLFDYFDVLIKEHEEKLDPEAPRDLIDAYLIEMKDWKDESGGVRSYMDLKYLLFNLFVAGSDTTSDTMKWLYLYMAAYPDKQRKMQEEIDSVLPKDEIATMEDKTRLPYTEAVINELLRMSSLVNIGVFHSAVKDTMLAGYKIPKGTMVTTANDSIHRDERYWDQPDRFLPERWIGPDGKFVMKKEGFLPFSMGKRTCIGEGMSRTEIFIFTTAVFQRFSVAAPDGKQIDLLPNYDIFLGHKPRIQNLVFTLRSP